MYSIKAITTTLIVVFIFRVSTLIAQVEEGEEAPGFSLESLEGDTYTLSKMKGKVVYIFFFGAGCPHCRANGPVTEENIYQEFKEDTNFVALGLETWNQSASAVESFRNVTGISYPLLLEARQILVNYYGSSSAYDRSVVIDTEGNISYKGTGYVDTDAQTVAMTISDLLEDVNTSVEDGAGQNPRKTRLLQNYPNPFNPATTIQYRLAEAGNVELSIYNPLGQKITTLVSGRKGAGLHTVRWEAATTSNQRGSLASSVYYYQLRTNHKTLTRQMLLMK